MPANGGPLGEIAGHLRDVREKLLFRAARRVFVALAGVLLGCPPLGQGLEGLA